MSADEAGQQLAAHLRELRGLTGISGRDLAQRLGISQPTVSRIESGRLVPTIPVGSTWARECGGDAETVERLRRLTEEAHVEVNRFRTALRERPHLQDDIKEFEASARTVRVFQPSVVPGLLQTPEYARRVFSLFQLPYSKETLASAVAARMDRQLALYDEDRRFEFLVTEAALRWRPGPVAVLVAQLGRLAAFDTLDNVSIGLIPADAEAVTFTSHGFALYDTVDEDEDEDEPMISVETVHANLTVRTAEDVALYRQRWSLLSEMAVFGDDAAKFLADLTEHIRTLR